MQEGFVFTGITEAPTPIYRSNKLKNVVFPKMQGAFRHVYSYRPQQWFFVE